MINNNALLLGTGNVPIDTTYVPVTITKNLPKYGVRLRTPGVIDKREQSKEVCKVHFPFSLCEKGAQMNLYRGHIKIEKHTSFNTNSCVRTKLHFSNKDLDEVIGETKKHGVVITIMSKKCALDILSNFNKLLKRYKHHHVFDLIIEAKRSKDVLPTLTFFDIKYCIPIFDAKEADGIGIIYRTIPLEFVNKKSSKFMAHSGVTMALSQSEDDLLFTDGILINHQRSIQENEMEFLKDGLKDVTIPRTLNIPKKVRFDGSIFADKKISLPKISFSLPKKALLSKKVPLYHMKYEAQCSSVSSLEHEMQYSKLME